MAVKLRLRRMGKKRQPIYKVVAADERSPRDGKFIEALGLYNPKTNPVTVDIKEDRVNYWLDVGAQPTDTVKNLLSRKGIFLKRDMVERGLSEEQIESGLLEFNKLQEEKVAKKLKVKGKAKKSEPETEAKTEVKDESKPETEVKTEVKPETETEVKAETKPETETEVKAEVKPETETEV
ncbi:MAG: 30S ribosomal protein S16, partial [Melioribacteraceae bacterium]|nr:30S ribosomal protein S16 [Melioribacteraceae bacterium]